jgi:PH (Pleckstrin Homology) domain-containing protein
MSAIFRSKIDGNLKVVGLAMPCVALVALGTNARHSGAVLLLLAIMAVLIAGMVVWIVLSTYYEFTHDLLVAHSGPFAWRIPLAQISNVRESRSVRSGPALSMDRLEVTWSGRHVLLISPQDKAGFLAVLHRRAPQLASMDRGTQSAGR